MKQKTKTKQGRREWVKNAIIIFLAVLLVLTFFSNTIMNYSLPEVAAQYPQSAAITTKIRGTGVVEAAQSYNVQVDETRKVASVNVKVGDAVAAGQLLLTLDEAESEELALARENYDALKLEYDKMTLDMGEQSFAAELSMQQLKDAVAQAQEDLAEAREYEDDLDYYQDKVSAAENSVDARQEEVNSIQKSLGLLQNEKDNLKINNAEYLAADEKVDEAEEKVEEIQERQPEQYLVTARILETSADTEAGEDPDSTIAPPEPSGEEEAPAEGEETAGEDEETAGEGEETDPAADAEAGTEETETTPEPSAEPEDTEEEEKPINPEYTAWEAELDAAKKELEEAIEARDELLEELELELDQRIAVKNAAQINASAGVTSANNILSSASKALSDFQNEYKGKYQSAAAAEEALKAAEDALAAAEAAAADDQVQTVYDDAVAALDQTAHEEKLKAAEEKVKALEEHAAGVEVLSRYAGVVTEVNIAAGDSTQAETTLVVVELTQQGYTLSATVTKEQAKTLRQGLTAEITNLWNSDINLVLQSITNDKNDPANSRTLNFSVQGDVAVGQELSFSIGDKNAKYDVVLPSAAIHSDADGSFVYTVAVKSSPLGNRYTVRRTDVTVLASDELNSAVSGDISTADFVITTSTLPLEEGDQIRIAE